MKFSIITASFNPGDKLVDTIKSILKQTYDDYEVIIKDGLSTDDSLQKLENEPEIAKQIADGKIRVIRRQDKNVYDGMNQALSYCMGEFILFLNCGDLFYSRQVLEEVAAAISVKHADGEQSVVFYGNTYCSSTDVMVHSAPAITGFTCYRNIPCHQSCFYSKALFNGKKYDINLKIRADYDHFLWCFYEKKAEFCYLDIVVADYEGGGISESAENQRRDKEEHKMVIRRYMGTSEIMKYKTIMLLTLAPLRRWIAESKALSGIYHKVKNKIYG